MSATVVGDPLPPAYPDDADQWRLVTNEINHIDMKATFAACPKFLALLKKMREWNDTIANGEFDTLNRLKFLREYASLNYELSYYGMNENRWKKCIQLYDNYITYLHGSKEPVWEDAFSCNEYRLENYCSYECFEQSYRPKPAGYGWQLNIKVFASCSRRELRCAHCLRIFNMPVGWKK